MWNVEACGAMSSLVCPEPVGVTGERGPSEPWPDEDRRVTDLCGL
jgi:hypothetical protein